MEPCELHDMVGCATCSGLDKRSDAYPERRNTNGVWTERDIAIARNHKLSHKEVAQLIGKTYPAVASYRWQHNLVPKQHKRDVDYTAERAMQPWTENELRTLEFLMTENRELDEMAATLRRSRISVWAKIEQLSRPEGN